VSEDRDLHDEVRAVWDGLAAFWDNLGASRNVTWPRDVILPSVERLLLLQPGERILDIACGNGGFARRMSDLGAHVLATDFSEGMLERARSHEGAVEYRSADATVEEQLLALGEPGSFDAVVSNMAIMDMESIEPMAAASARLLKDTGRFVFSTLHPSFNSGDVRPTVELDLEGRGAEVYSVKVSSYSRPSRRKGVAFHDQPVEQWYFHRPLWMILDSFFEHGFVLDGLEEPLVPDPDWKTGAASHVFTQVPGVLVARLRLVT
jgi:ubiquinone/menaquinone biosynthesis C-methylase UbiE